MVATKSEKAALVTGATGQKMGLPGIKLSGPTAIVSGGANSTFVPGHH